jgi:uncharacterized protein (TIGR04552 family)
VAIERPYTSGSAGSAASTVSNAVLERLNQITLGDLEAVRLLLAGSSVIDWHRLAFRDLDDVDRFLRVNEFRPSDPKDLERLEFLRAEAVEYLQRNFDFRIPDEIVEHIPVRDLFLVASRKTRRQMFACIVLKVMHIIHHLYGRQLLHQLPISEQEVFRLVERKVVRVVEELRAAGHPISEVEWSRKPHDSLITKLMAKKSTLAASVYDKLRFRLVVKERDDLLPLLNEMMHRLIPFNYVVPGESVNDLVPLRHIAETTPSMHALVPQLQSEFDPEDGAHIERANEFSGPSYRVVNFVADMPVRLDDFLCRIGSAQDGDFGQIVFVLTEFQLLDARQAQANEAGENSHEKYKERQRARVKLRLTRGLPVERPATAPVAPADAPTQPGREPRHGTSGGGGPGGGWSGDD